MKLFTPEISWHQKEPIFSVDFCPKTWKLASCGADFTVKIWLVKEKKEDDSSIGLEFLSNLDRHAKPVNVVRFSPDGKYLASAGDDGTIILWKLNELEKPSAGDLFDDDDAINKESWTVHKMLRGHIEDVYDLAWSPDSTQLISGSVDNSAILWDAVKGQNLKILTDHKHYVQGVCWDPRGFYIATHSSDRSCRLYHAQNHKCLHNIHKNISSYKNDEQLIKTKLSRMFLDETMKSFFRRCTFSPDGSFLFLPAGICDGEKKSRKTTYVFARGHFKCPIRQLPGPKKATVAVKCSPIVYELKENKENCKPFKESTEFFKVPYRMVYAVASIDAVTFYDTQHEHPIGHCANMHYASLTDMTWSSDGKLLVISSTDGYCSFVKFDENELGTPILYDPLEYQVSQAKMRAAALKTKKKEKKEAEKKESIILQNTDNCQTVASPKSSVDNKEKVPKSLEQKEKKSLDRNQPTIDKLFVTPVRKRKRPSEVSPVNDAKRTPTATSAPGQVIDLASPISHKTEDVEQKSSAISTLSGTPKKEIKTPKRAQVVTLSNRSPSRTAPPIKSCSPVKQPKRISVTTLMTFTSEETNTASSITTATASILSPPKPPKRVAVTTLSTTTSMQRQKCSEKPPKRVVVTTLSTDVDTQKTDLSETLSISENLIGNGKTPKRMAVTTISSSYDPESKDSKKRNEISSERINTSSDSRISSVQDATQNEHDIEKTPKPAEVTTKTIIDSKLSEKGSKLNEKSPKRVHTITSLFSKSSGQSPKSSVASTTTTPSTKPPKRVQVTTLTTFNTDSKTSDKKDTKNSNANEKDKTNEPICID